MSLCEFILTTTDYRCKKCGFHTPVAPYPPIRKCTRPHHKRRETRLGKAWLKDSDFLRACDKIAAQLPWPVRGIAGVPRSGLMAAAHVAIRLNVPLYEISERGLRACHHGLRLQGGNSQGPLVVLDDSVNTGSALKRVRKHIPKDSILAALFVNPTVRNAVDIAAYLHDMPHFFSWHFLGSNLVCSAGFDLDGVICEDCPRNLDDDGRKYRDWIQTVKPLLLPRPHVVPLIVTARLEKYRSFTERWLTSYGIRWDKLVMGPWGTLSERRAKYRAVDHKGVAFAKSGLKFFIESDVRQAREIARATRRTVICPTTGEVL